METDLAPRVYGTMVTEALITPIYFNSFWTNGSKEKSAARHPLPCRELGHVAMNLESISDLAGVKNWVTLLGLAVDAKKSCMTRSPNYCIVWELLYHRILRSCRSFQYQQYPWVSSPFRVSFAIDSPLLEYYP